MILLDANILVHAHAVKSPFHVVARGLCEQAVEGTLDVCVSPQVLCEFFAVSTNERLFQPALTPRQASQVMADYWRGECHTIIPQDRTVLTLVELIERYRIMQQHVFDAFLVATMLDNGVRTIYTQNVKDFEFYHELQVVNPLTGRATVSESSS